LLKAGGSTQKSGAGTNATPWQASASGPSEMQHVAVLDDVFLAFCTHLPCVLRALLTPVLDEVVIRDGLGADVAAFEICMDDARRLGAGVANVDGPGEPPSRRR
jgi:uncharacterized protein YllA (UPF0747 family)